MISTIIEIDGTPINAVVMDMEYGITEEVCWLDDYYTIFLNSHYDRESMIAAYSHAVNHIKRDDFDRPDVQEIENENHQNETRLHDRHRNRSG